MMSKNLGSAGHFGVVLTVVFAAASMSGCDSAPKAVAFMLKDTPPPPVSQQYAAMKCHEAHPDPENDDDPKHPKAEHPMYLEDNKWVLKPEYAEARQLWAQSMARTSIVYGFDKKNPVAGGKIDTSNINSVSQGIIVMGCTDQNGSSDYNMKLSFKRANRIAAQFEGYEVCILPLSEYCDDLKFSSGLVDYTGGEHAKLAKERFVSIRVYNRTFDDDIPVIDEPPAP